MSVTSIDWGSVADWVSGLGSIGASIVALHLAGSERRARREADRPHISCDLSIPSDEWANFSIRLENPSQKQWTLTSIDVAYPSEGVIVTSFEAMIEVNHIRRFDPATRDAAARRVLPQNLKLSPAGTVTSSIGGGGRGDVVWQRHYVRVGTKAVRLRIRLKLESSDPMPERFTVNIERMIIRKQTGI